MSTKRKVLFASVVTVATMLIVVAVGEIVLRISYGKVERITGVSDWKLDVGPEGLAYFWDEYHPRFGWTNVPGYRSDERVPFRVSINLQRLRGSVEYDPTPPPGLRRIAVFGDSFAFGEEVDDDQTIPVYLGRWLDNVEVINFAVRGWGLGQMALRLEEEGFAFHPDHVVIVVSLPSDLSRDVLDQFGHNKPVFGVEGSKLVVGNVPVPLASSQPWLQRHSFSAAWLFGRPSETPKQPSFDATMRVTQAIMARVNQHCRRVGVPWTLVTVVGPSWIRTMQSHQRWHVAITHMRRTIRASGADVLDLIEYLRQAGRREGEAISAAMGHYTHKGNCLIAGQIAQHLSAGHGYTRGEAGHDVCDAPRPDDAPGGVEGCGSSVRWMCFWA